MRRAVALSVTILLGAGAADALVTAQPPLLVRHNPGGGRAAHMCMRLRMRAFVSARSRVLVLSWVCIAWTTSSTAREDAWLRQGACPCDHTSVLRLPVRAVGLLAHARSAHTSFPSSSASGWRAGVLCRSGVHVTPQLKPRSRTSALVMCEGGGRRRKV